MKISKVKKFAALAWCFVLLASAIIPFAYAFDQPTICRCVAAFAVNAFLTYCAFAYASDYIGKRGENER